MSVQGTHLTVIADAIREKEGAALPIPAGTFAERILALPFGEEATGAVLPAAETQAERLARIAAAIRAKEGSSESIPASQFAARILALPERQASRLPEGYTEIEYIQSGSGQYIKTGVYATADDLQKIVMDVEPTDATGCFFGVYQGGNGTSYYSYFQASQTKGEGAVSFYIQKTKEAVNFDASNQRVTVSFDRGKRVGSVNDLTTNVFPTPMTAYGELVLLARNNLPSSGSNVTFQLPAKLYACQMYKDAETLVRDFVPCINPGGIAGLYDLVGGAFYKSPISTNFTAGPAV